VFSTVVKKGGQIIGINYVSNPKSYLTVVNKTQRLSENYLPPNLKVPSVSFFSSSPPAKKLLRARAAAALKKMQQAAQQHDLQLIGVSGYRSYYRQQQIYQIQLTNKGKVKADKISAQAGHSEHQTGLAIDISSPEINCQLSEELATTSLGSWLAKHSFKFGFILRYPVGKEWITGYQYEPWHFRYVGVGHAQKIYNNNLTLEDYCN